MANVQHSALTGSDLHEPKGASGASADTVYVADGAGSGAWSAYPNIYSMSVSIPHRGNTSNTTTQYRRLYIPITGTITAVCFSWSYPGTATVNSGAYLYNSSGTSNTIASTTVTTTSSYTTNTSPSNTAVTAGNYLTFSQTYGTSTGAYCGASVIVYIQV